LYERIEAAARASDRSIANEIEARLEKSFESQGIEALAARLDDVAHKVEEIGPGLLGLLRGYRETPPWLRYDETPPWLRSDVRPVVPPAWFRDVGDTPAHAAAAPPATQDLVDALRPHELRAENYAPHATGRDLENAGVGAFIRELEFRAAKLGVKQPLKQILETPIEDLMDLHKRFSAIEYGAQQASGERTSHTAPPARAKGGRHGE
jgi:hypothetical protein